MREFHEKKYSVLDIQAVSSLAREDAAAFVEKSEAYYNDQVTTAAKIISREAPRYKFVLLCGPSASGKTTTAHKLKHRLVYQGVGARVVSMDNFFKGMEHYPKLPNGKPDMESVQALDTELLNGCFDELLRKGKARFPLFDFARQEQQLEAHDIALEKNGVLIMEGIHALNPMVLSNIPPENIFRIYVSVRTKFLAGEETVLVPKDIRLIRRMVRDYQFRNYPPLHTLQYWRYVVAGEKRNIDPYRDGVDLKMDNTLDYEVCVWHQLLHSLLEREDLTRYREYPELERIFDGLLRFPELDYRLIPKNSLLREFIGESV